MNIFNKYDIFKSSVTSTVMMQKSELVRILFFMYNFMYNYKSICACPCVVVFAHLPLLVLIDTGLLGKSEDHATCSSSCYINYICR